MLFSPDEDPYTAYCVAMRLCLQIVPVPLVLAIVLIEVLQPDPFVLIELVLQERYWRSDQITRF